MNIISIVKCSFDFCKKATTICSYCGFVSHYCKKHSDFVRKECCDNCQRQRREINKLAPEIV